MYWIVGNRGLLGQQLIRACILENLPFLGIVKNGSKGLKSFERSWDDMLSKSHKIDEPIVLINAAGRIAYDSQWTLSKAIKLNLEPLVNCLSLVESNSTISLYQISSTILSRPEIRTNKSKYVRAKIQAEKLIQSKSLTVGNRIGLIRLPALLDFNYQHSELISSIVRHAQGGSTFVPRNPGEILGMLTSGDAAKSILKFSRGTNFATVELPGVNIKVEKLIQIFLLVYDLNLHLDLKKNLTIDSIIANHPEILSNIDESDLLYYLSFLIEFTAFIKLK